MNTYIEVHKILIAAGFIYRNARMDYIYKNNQGDILYKIILYPYYYVFYNNSKCIEDIKYDDLSIIKKSIRSIKLKKILDI